MSEFTNSSIHELQYRVRREKGFVGWNDQTGTEWFLDRVRQWVDSGHYPQGGRVLELGCGAGDLSLMLAEMGFQVKGIDFSSTAIEWATQKAKDRGLSAEFYEGDVLQPPFQNGAFDWVIDGSCWHCIIGEGRNRFLYEVYRILRTGGIFTGMPMVNGTRIGQDSGYDPSTRIQIIDRVPVRYWALVPEILCDLSTSGFRVHRSQIFTGEDGSSDDVMFVDATRS